MSCSVLNPSTKNIGDLKDYVRPYVPEVSLTIIEFNLRASLIEFARRTGVMHRVVEIHLQEGMTTYPIILDDCLQGVRIRSVCYGGHTSVFPKMTPPCCECGGFTFYLDNPGCITIGREPSFTDECQLQKLRIHLEVAPTQDTCNINEEVFNLWGETVAYGAMARILMIPNKAFSDKDASVMYDRKFKEGVKKARSDINAGYTRNGKATFGRAIVFRGRR